MHLFTADGFEGEPAACDEGQLEWVDIDRVWKLNIWEGDKIFFRLIDEDVPFFSLKLVYNGSGGLVSAVLNGEPMELFDILNEDGTKSGLVRERGVAHREGSLHETVHTWIVRKAEKRWEVLLQKRSAVKDSNPGCYDISSAGHLSSGDIPLEGALRELKEELGLTADREDFHYVGKHRGSYRAPFHGRLFCDNELSNVYVITRPFDKSELSLPEDLQTGTVALKAPVV
jgi:8-oxo-dGTP diphosphatase